MSISTDRERMQANQTGWSLVANANVSSTYYDLDRFRAGRSSLRSLEREEVGDVSGRSLLHLQCHIGLNAISWAGLGAKVTAVDFAEEAIRIARGLAAGLERDVRFVCSNVYDLPEVLEGAFDIVYTDYGVLSYLPDLQRWAQIVAHYLKPGGRFHIVEIYPILEAFDEVDGEMRLRPALFEDRGAMAEEISTAYGDRFEDEVAVPSHTQYIWPWTLSGLVNALAGAGLHIERMREVPVDCRQRFSTMVPDGEEGCWRLPGDPLPLSIAITARKPE